MVKFEKPDFKVEEYSEDIFYGRFVLEPLERGYGMTIGNALRRVLVSSLPGAAVKSIKIDGILHEFQTLEGVLEDVTHIILNIKNLVLKINSDEEKTLTINVNKSGAITAADIECDSDVEIINLDHHIATLSAKREFSMEMVAVRGKGYVPSFENKSEIQTVSVLPIDSMFTPIRKVTYKVEKTRVGQNASYDRLILDVWTNGALKPEEAISLGSKILVEHFNIIADLNDISQIDGLMNEKEENLIDKALETPVENLNLTVRAYNCLKRAGIHTVQDLTEKTEAEMIKVKNLGKISLEDVIRNLHELGLDLKRD